MQVPSTAQRLDPPRALWWLLLAASAAATLLFLFGVGQRLFYPFEVEWMEGALVDHASRIAEGLPLYCQPGPHHVPFLYAPLPFWLGGAAMAAGIDGLFAMRAIATASSIGAAMMIGHWVRRETGRVVPGLVASGMFFAGYGWLAWWYDLARNDMPFVLLCVATAYVQRHGGRHRWLPAALLATAAFLTKQSALMWLPAVGIGALCHDRRSALRFGTASAAGIVAAVGLMHVASDGWSTFFLFEMPRHHGWDLAFVRLFWTIDMLPMLPMLALGIAGFAAQWRAGRRGEALYLAAFGCGGIATSWFSRLHVGGFDNVLMYGFTAACVLGPTAVARAERPRLRAGGALLLLVQFVWLGVLAVQRDPGATLVPSDAHRRAHEELAAFVARQPGPVWIPGHGGISHRAGKGTGAHGQAIFDLMQLLPRDEGGLLDLEALTDHGRLSQLSPRAREAVLGFRERAIAALRDREFAAVVLDDLIAGPFTTLFGMGLAGPDGVPDTADDPYVQHRDLLTEPAAIAPLLGYPVHSPYALTARD
jgi:hypothetical protein